MDGQQFYLPHDPLPGTVPLYRLSSAIDRMPALDPSEAGMHVDGVLGYPFLSAIARPGLAHVVRGYKPTNGDHALKREDEILSGYSNEGFSVYGWPRYGAVAESMLTISAGGVTVGSNRVAGGSVWSWVWNGWNFVDTRDFGREIQAALFAYDDESVPGGLLSNPTEAGSWVSGAETPGYMRQGSPLLFAYNSGNTQYTRCVPLDFESFQPHLGGNEDIPILWADMELGKELTLDFAGLGPVAKYVAVMKIPNWVSTPAIEIPTAYIKYRGPVMFVQNGIPFYSLFNRYFTYSAQTPATGLVEVTLNPIPGAQHYQYNIAYGGVIIANTQLNYALGVYGVSPSEGGSVSYYTLFKFPTADPGGAVSKWSAVYHEGAGGLPAGTHTFNSWLISGTLTAVVEKMNLLYNLGVR